jgi:hypothetical protein
MNATKTRFGDLKIGDRFHNGISLGVGSQAKVKSWFVLEKITPSKGKIKEAHGDYGTRHVNSINCFSANSIVFKITN